MLATPFDNICIKPTLLMFIFSICVWFLFSLNLVMIIISESTFTFKTGVSSYKVDLETKIVVVMGDILPSEVLQSVSKVKNAEIWNSQGGKQ